jgi:hypothetical protein
MVTGSGAWSEAGVEGGGRAGAGAGAGRHRLTEPRNPLRPSALGPTQVLPIAAGTLCRLRRQWRQRRWHWTRAARRRGWLAQVGSGDADGGRGGTKRNGTEQLLRSDDAWARCRAGAIVSDRSVAQHLEPSDIARDADRGCAPNRIAVSSCRLKAAFITSIPVYVGVSCFRLLGYGPIVSGLLRQVPMARQWKLFFKKKKRKGETKIKIWLN